MEQSTIKILVVDDEAEFVELFVKRLQKRPFQVASAQSGQEALGWLDKNSVDIVILDIKMPGMNGIETLKEIKKRQPFVEVLILTGHGSIESSLQGIHHGAYDCIMKPFDMKDLLYKVQKAYERRQLMLAEKQK